MSAIQSAIGNAFLGALSPSDFRLLAPSLAPVDLPRRMILVTENRPIEYVYFPESGFASIVALTPEREIIEVGAFGCEGSSNFVLQPGSDRVPLRTFMQIGGGGWRMTAEAFSSAIHASPTLMSIVMRYEQYKAIQFAFTALSHGSFTIPERLARWVLIAQDRVGSDIAIVHEYLAQMLAVRRSGVTEAIQKLEGMGCIKATRALIQVKDRDKLIELADGSYGVPEREYERLIGPMVRRA